MFEEIIGTEKYDIESARHAISERIYEIMTTENISIEELSRRLGRPRGYVTNLLKGNVNFTLEACIQIGRALGYKFNPEFAKRGTPIDEADPELNEN